MTKTTNTPNEVIIETIYNLILNPETTDEERALLVAAKTDLADDHKDQDKILVNLQRDIQRLAMKHVSDEVSLSPGVKDLSQQLTDLQNEAEREANIARGLLSSVLFFGH